MPLFDLFKKSGKNPEPSIQPYKESATNLIYNLLFCDNLELYKTNTATPHNYPFDVLFAEQSSPADLQRITGDPSADPRVKVLAYNKLLATGQRPERKELLGVIVEVGLDLGLDVLAAFSNGTARYINQTGKIIIWEAPDETSTRIISELFEKSRNIVSQIGPWDQARRPQPAKGNVRISFLVSDGLYFGEGPINVLFNDPFSSPALQSATELMQYLTTRPQS